MGYRCPKCRYERKPTDDAPDWQCPACGVAYAKAGGSGPGQHNVRQHYVAAQSKKGGFGLRTVLVQVVLVAGGFYLLGSRQAQSPNAAVAMDTSSGQPSERASTSKVVLYATQTCGYCRLTREFFSQHRIRYREIDIEASRKGFQKFRALGGRGVPVVTLGGDVLHGYNKGKLKRLLTDHDLL